MRHIIKSSTKPGAVVLDCFAGSGSTGCAAAELGRDFIGIEKDEASVRTAQGRVLKILQETREWETQREIHRLATTIPEDDEPIVPV
jgi:DNA modification methylase